MLEDGLVVPEAFAGDGRRVTGLRPPPRTKKGIQTRSQLVDAAKVVFERDGFLKARIVDIAETAQLATGSFYHYFDSKEQIFREVAAMQERRLTAPPDSHGSPPDPDGTTWSRIRRANRRYLERYREAAALMGVIEEVSRYDSEVNAARMDTMKHFVERAERAIVELQGQGLADTRLSPSWPPTRSAPWSDALPSSGSSRGTGTTTSTRPWNS